MALLLARDLSPDLESVCGDDDDFYADFYGRYDIKSAKVSTIERQIFLARIVVNKNQ
jgi:hypothetical protein